jgi:hypothetical protein
MIGMAIMKRPLTLLFLLFSVLYAPAECPDNPCSHKITEIGDCPDEGCRQTKLDKEHPYDAELNKVKNIRSDDQPSVLRSIRWIKGLEDPKNLIECGTREELKQLGEGQKITVVAWALTARKGSKEKCNCDLGKQDDTDNHIVLVDPAVKNPTLAKHECSSVITEFTPRVRKEHPKFTQRELNSRIDPNWKPKENNANGKLLVRVTGLLMFDSGHIFRDPLPRDTKEIHPVLKMEYCPKGKTCRADSDENWKDLDNG